MKIWAVAVNTFKETIRDRILYNLLVFALLVMVIFNFAFGTGADTAELAPGILWVAFAFSGVLALNRAFIPEKEENCLEGLMP